MASPVVPADFQGVISDPTTSLCGNFINTLLKFPTLFYKFIKWMLKDDGTLTDDFKAATIGSQSVTGMVVMSACTLDASSGWLKCDGTAVSRTTYATLFGMVGTIFGPGDGSSTFNLPNMTNKFARGQSPASTGGEDTHTLSQAELPAVGLRIKSDGTAGFLQSNHSTGSDITDYGLSLAAQNPGKTAVTENMGSGAAHNNVPAWVGLFFYIKY
jgi:microcystin-dependent protein